MYILKQPEEKWLLPMKNKRKPFNSKDFRSIWRSIKRRIAEKDNKYYGNKGITMNESWYDYKVFQKYILENIGERKSYRHSLDRIDVNGNYEPGNLRWATDKEQANNRTTTIYVEYNNIKMTLTEAAEKSGVPYKLLYSRVYNKININKLFLPLEKILSLFEIEEIKKSNNKIKELSNKYLVSINTIVNVKHERGAYKIKSE